MSLFDYNKLNVDLFLYLLLHLFCVNMQQKPAAICAPI